LLILVERLEAFTVEAQGYAARLLNRIGPYYEARGQGERAERLLRKALELAGEDHGSDTHTLRGSILTNLGNIQRDRGELVIAGQTFAEALALKELALGRNHLLTAISCSALATVAEALGNTEEARELYQRGLDVYREVDDRPRAADALLDLARLMVTTAGATDEHLTLIQEAIAALDGIDDGWAEAVTARMDLARHYEMRSDLPNAARAARDAVRIARLQAPESIELAKALSTHGEILSQLGIQPDGFRLLHRAIEMFERVESPNHVDAARMRGNLGWALYRVGDISHAFRYLKQSEEVISGLLPGGHHSVAMARYMLANGLAAMGRFDQAVELARTAIADAVRPQDLQLLQTLLADLEDSINRINAQSP